MTNQTKVLSTYKPFKDNWMKPDSGKVTIPICYMGDYTGCNIADTFYPADLTCGIHKGITIGNGKTLYWMMVWHGKSGNVTVYNNKASYGRYISGDQLITIHWLD
jgi:hypothetical protein